MAADARFVGPRGTFSDIALFRVKRGAASAVGLLGRTDMGPDEALMLKARQVHTIGMRFAIDVLYIDAAKTVIKVQTLRPGRVGPIVWRARFIIEMKKGEAARRGIAPGWRLEVDGG